MTGPDLLGLALSYVCGLPVWYRGIYCHKCCRPFLNETKAMTSWKYPQSILSVYLACPLVITSLRQPVRIVALFIQLQQKTWYIRCNSKRLSANLHWPDTHRMLLLWVLTECVWKSKNLFPYLNYLCKKRKKKVSPPED